MQFDDVIVPKDVVAGDAEAVPGASLAPDPGKIEFFGEILVNCPGHVHDGAALFQGEWGIRLRLLSGDFAVDADDPEEAEEAVLQFLDVEARLRRYGDPFERPFQEDVEVLKGLPRSIEVALVGREECPF